jgi:hypothetical protein
LLFKGTERICSTEKRFFISKILNPLQARFLPKTNIYRGSKYPRSIKFLAPHLRGDDVISATSVERKAAVEPPAVQAGAQRAPNLPKIASWFSTSRALPAMS